MHLIDLLMLCPLLGIFVIDDIIIMGLMLAAKAAAATAAATAAGAGAVGSAAAGAAGTVGGAIGSAAGSVGGAIGSGLGSMGSSLASTAGAIGSGLGEAAGGVASMSPGAIGSGLMQAGTGVLNAVPNLAAAAIPGGATGAGAGAGAAGVPSATAPLTATPVAGGGPATPITLKSGGLESFKAMGSAMNNNPAAPGSSLIQGASEAAKMTPLQKGLMVGKFGLGMMQGGGQQQPGTSTPLPTPQRPAPSESGVQRTPSALGMGALNVPQIGNTGGSPRVPQSPLAAPTSQGSIGSLYARTSSNPMVPPRPISKMPSSGMGQSWGSPSMFSPPPRPGVTNSDPSTFKMRW